MAITKDFRCNTCNHEFEIKQPINDPNPKCPKCEGYTSWLPKLNSNPPQISYTLRVLCDGFDTTKVHERVV